ncbi:AAA domain (Cdc48 subfamily) [Bradyrhizobium sp. Ghvi]|uniref:AAA family ATPase n=1 Tax=Bradyrhizobium sp. Ghvi TaxID=1855319 RepID=UPI0008E15989|nr:AAA family ATPase [Bradyrhizobium sp. Ghvi]SFQ18086.1 AAA domain (Cdc48 subfamily) [Bradyrhizobium sp. Ghvi]
MHDSSVERARWLRDLLRFLPLRSQFVLSGNTRDLQIHEVGQGEVTAAPLSRVLPDVLKAAGYGRIAWFDLLNGFREVEPADGSYLTQLGLVPSAGTAAGGIDLLSMTLERHVMAEGQPSALIIDFASRLIARNDALAPAEHQLFSRALILSHAARTRPAGDKRLPFFNTVVWIVDKEGDLPDWFLIGNPKIRHVPIGRPDHLARRSMIRSLVRSLPGAQNADQSELEKCTQGFVDETEGLLLLDVSAVAQLARSEGVQYDRIGDAVRRFKVGVTEDPWRKISRDKISSGEEFVRRRVKGQSHAVTHMLDIVKRAVTGIGQSPRGGRPRGVVFLAGPTGVGKTELAKTITSLLFGDESAYIRFDMSEFSAEHSDQRLIGAPPGYIGYDVGGELTNAIREKPFSVVLFDEIEKAHPRILDKFLQVLDDGVLTSGRGDRVYFSEAFIVFTSNLGIYVPGPSGERIANVTPEESFQAVRSKVRSEIEKHFKQVLNRPEILNRIGENVIVFDFIRVEVANEIFDQMVDNLLRDVKSLGCDVKLTGAAREVLRSLCLSDLSNGGRGIRNQVESHLINPLSRSLFDRGAEAGHRYRIEQIRPGPSTTIDLVSEDSP